MHRRLRCLSAEITSSLRFTHAPLDWCCTIGTGLDYDQSLSALHLPNIWQRANDQGNLFERYWYGAEGMGVKKTRGNTTTYSFFAQYEEEVTNGRNDGNQPLQLWRAAHCGQARQHPLPFARRPSRQHLADHRRRGGRDSQPRLLRLRRRAQFDPAICKTDRTFTGQKRDATGLM